MQDRADNGPLPENSRISKPRGAVSLFSIRGNAPGLQDSAPSDISFGTRKGSKASLNRSAKA